MKLKEVTKKEAKYKIEFYGKAFYSYTVYKKIGWFWFAIGSTHYATEAQIIISEDKEYPKYF